MTSVTDSRTRIESAEASEDDAVADPVLESAGPEWADPPPPAGAGLSAATSAALMVGLVTVWFVLQLLFLGGISQGRAQDELYSQLREELAQAEAPVGGLIEPGQPVALMSIPRLSLHQVVIEGTASGDTLAGPGHRRDTPLPGQAGVSLVYGRASTHGAPFRDIAQLKRGDKITVVTGVGEAVFRVSGVRREGDPVPTTLAEGEGRLTLVSAESEVTGRLAAVAPESVVYVDADLTGEAFEAPGGRAASVPASERAMAADGSALPLLSLLLGILVVLAFAVVTLSRRMSTALVWVLATPLAITLAWLVTETAMRLLPNLM
ncbi:MULTISPECIES: sortase domain-containing protein [unclassified Janibacter]|uniref:sortase domain-containing protein n=1 Tax=unclassified Janibacter TaxID=2649294 RepID=UPI003D0566B8